MTARRQWPSDKIKAEDLRGHEAMLHWILVVFTLLEVRHGGCIIKGHNTINLGLCKRLNDNYKEMPDKIMRLILQKGSIQFNQFILK